MILGIDPGERRVGLAVADLETRFATPLEVIDSTIRHPLERISEVIVEKGVTHIVVGRPVALTGVDGPAVEKQKNFLDQLRTSVSIPVDVYDERMTTVMAERQMRDAGASPEKRKAMRDAVAAQVMLQGYLDSKR